MRLWLLPTTNWSCWLPRTHVPYRYSAQFVSRQCAFTPALNAASHSKAGQGLQEAWPKAIFVSDRVIDHKSVFQAHATELNDVASLTTFLDHLTSLPSLKRVTHFMYAYRSTDKSQGTEKPAYGQNDGGESGSGDRLSRLLELSDCKNVIVVVTRWYGGTKLGSNRWKRISEVAKEALGNGGFLNSDQGSTVGKKRRR